MQKDTPKNLPPHPTGGETLDGGRYRLPALDAIKWVCPALLMLMLLIGPAVCLQAGTVQADTPPGSKRAWTSPLDFYQNLMSRADGDRCPMAPSCSQYAKQAFEQHGFFIGWVLTCDRLLRCGHDEVHLAPAVRINGRRHALDPLEANTFWWDQR